MSNDIKTEKKKRTPKDAQAILVGALKLELAERVKLRDHLTRSIDSEIEQKEADLKAAKELVNSKQH